MLNIGVIGCGTVSGYGHLPTISASDDWCLLGIADINQEHLECVKKKYKLEHAFTNYHDLLELPGLDAVVVATQLDSHYKITVDALEKGLHVVCEKPMAQTVEQCRKMVEAAEKNKRFLVVNFNTRCGPIYREIKSLIDKGSVGTIRVVRIVLDWSCHQWKPKERLEQFMKNGGPIVDSGVHFFEGVRWFTGQEFERIEAEGVVLPPYENPQHVTAICKLNGGAMAMVEAGWLYCKRTKEEGSIFRIDVIGDDGAISYDNLSSFVRIYTRENTEERLLKDTGKHFEVVYAKFAESINEGKLVELASGMDGLRATEASFMALESAKHPGK